VSWASKKQNSVALSTAEAEYIAAGHCCAQLLWMRQTLRDYGYKFSKVPLLCDNESISIGISILQIGIPLMKVSQLVYPKTLLKAKRRISFRGSFV
jgi:hypothetical protein